MKFITIATLLLLTSCAQLMKGAEQPVTQYRDSKTFKTTCSGIAEHWDSCNRKAMRTCPGGYIQEEKIQDSQGAHRAIIFSCK